MDYFFSAKQKIYQKELGVTEKPFENHKHYISDDVLLIWETLRHENNVVKGRRHRQGIRTKRDLGYTV